MSFISVLDEYAIALVKICKLICIRVGAITWHRYIACNFNVNKKLMSAHINVARNKWKKKEEEEKNAWKWICLLCKTASMVDLTDGASGSSLGARTAHLAGILDQTTTHLRMHANSNQVNAFPYTLIFSKRRTGKSSTASNDPL